MSREGRKNQTWEGGANSGLILESIFVVVVPDSLGCSTDCYMYVSYMCTYTRTQI